MRQAEKQAAVLTEAELALVLEAVRNEEEAAREGTTDDPDNEENRKYAADLAALLSKLA